MPAVRRLAATLRQLGGGDSGITPGVAGRSSPGVQAEPPLKLLKDQDVKRWIVDGWLPLSTAGDLPAGLHDTVASKAKAMSTQGLGNNVFPAIPEIGDVLSSPTVRGALTSILGRDYFTHAHRHLHSSGKGDQGWHKDSYWGLRRMRHHRPRWCMILYFPQDTTEDMGPTGLLPRSQYFTRNHEGALQGEDQLDIRVSDGRMSSDELSQRDECLREAVASLEPHQPFQEMKAVVPAGTCILMHYDIFHRATRRIPDDANVPWRAMLKFQYVRTTEPMEPSWDSTAGAEANPFAFTNAPKHMQAIWESQWDWLSGRDTTPHAATDGQVQALGSVLSAEGELTSESERVGSGYQLASAAAAGSETALSFLMAGAVGEEHCRRAAMYGLASAGQAAVPSLLQLLHHEDDNVANHAAHALGEASRHPTLEVIGALEEAMYRGASHVTSDSGTIERILPAQMAARTGTDRMRVVKYGTDGRLLQATCAQALGCIGQRSAALGLASETSAVLGVLLDALENEAELPMPGGTPRTQKWLTKENAALGLITTSSGLPHLLAGSEGIDSALLERLSATLEAESETATDRYLAHYALEGIKSLGKATHHGNPLAMAQHKLFEKLLEERWCPFTDAQSQF